MADFTGLKMIVAFTCKFEVVNYMKIKIKIIYLVMQ